MKRMVIGIDAQFIHYSFRDKNWQKSFPYKHFRDFIEGDDDEILEIYAPVIRFMPASSRAEDIAKSSQDFYNKKLSLEAEGISVIEAPTKLSGGQTKHSDDQRLMIRLAFTCTRLKPDFLVLVAADGDYAPLVWGLREEGIRTKLITDKSRVARDLVSSAYMVSDLYEVLGRVEQYKAEQRF